jgi:hypothetical protein
LEPARTTREPESIRNIDRNESGSWVDQLNRILVAGRESAVILFAFLYLIGFAYYFTYLRTLGITPSLNDIPVYQLFVYSIIVLSRIVLVVVAIIMCVVPGLIVALAWRKSKNQGSKAVECRFERVEARGFERPSARTAGGRRGASQITRRNRTLERSYRFQTLALQVSTPPD